MTEQPTGKRLRSRSFLGLLTTQFLGALNDNMFRWLVVPIGKASVQEDKAALALSLGLASFVVPYLLLASVAGYLADRYSKRTVIVACKVAELVIMGLGVLSILSGDLYVMLGVIALMGTQSALFAPSKLGSIPEIVPTKSVAAANGLIGMTTVVAIIVGTIAGNVLFTVTTLTASDGELVKPAGQHLWWISAAALLAVSGAGLLAALQIGPLRVANPKRTFPYRAAHQTVRDLAQLGSYRPLLRAAMGCAVFWTLAAVAQMNVDLFAITELHLDQFHVGILLAVLALGVGSGSVLAGVWSSGRVELGIVPLGAAGIAVSAAALFAAPQANEVWLSPSYLWSCMALFVLGASAGLYNIPIQAFLQNHSPAASRGSILAASNFLAFSGMLSASAIFYVAHDLWQLSARQIFLMLGLATLPVLIYVVWLLPGATARVLVWLLSKTIYRVRVTGKQNLLGQGGTLLVANHVSKIDGLLLLLYFPRPPRILARADPAHGRLFRRLADDLGTIFIEPGKRSLVVGLKTARAALEGGEVVCIFPEGRITHSGDTEEFRRGFVSIVEGSDAPVVPVYLGGLSDSIFSWRGGTAWWKWPLRWPCPVEIVIGKPLAAPVDPETARAAVVALSSVEE